MPPHRSTSADLLGRSRWGKSAFRGVYLQSNGRYAVKIKHGGKATHVGVFRSERKAAEAYDLAAIRYHGAGATLNFPPEPAADVAPVEVSPPPETVEQRRVRHRANSSRAGLGAADDSEVQWRIALERRKKAEDREPYEVRVVKDAMRTFRQSTGD